MVGSYLVLEVSLKGTAGMKHRKNRLDPSLSPRAPESGVRQKDLESLELPAGTVLSRLFQI